MSIYVIELSDVVPYDKPFWWLCSHYFTNEQMAVNYLQEEGFDVYVEGADCYTDGEVYASIKELDKFE